MDVASAIVASIGGRAGGNDVVVTMVELVSCRLSFLSDVRQKQNSEGWEEKGGRERREKTRHTFRRAQ